MASKVYDVLHLRVLWHLHEAQSCFCHRGDGSGENWIRNIVELLVEVTRADTSVFRGAGPTLSPALFPCSASCSSTFILILWSVYSQIIL